MSLSDEIAYVRKFKDNPEKAPPNESNTCDWVILPLLWEAGYERDEIVSRAPDAAGKYSDYTILPHTPYT